MLFDKNDFAIANPGQTVFVRLTKVIDIDDYNILMRQAKIVSEETGVYVVIMPEWTEVAKITDENA